MTKYKRTKYELSKYKHNKIQMQQNTNGTKHKHSKIQEENSNVFSFLFLNPSLMGYFWGWGRNQNCFMVCSSSGTTLIVYSSFNSYFWFRLNFWVIFDIAKLSPSPSSSWAELALISTNTGPVRPDPTWPDPE